MPSFDDAWKAVARARDGEPVSQDLKPLLHAVYLQFLSDAPNVTDIQNSLEQLLQFLISDGRTNANCWAVDLFFGNSEGWEKDWAERDLPEELHDVIATMGEALHDTVRAPEFARHYGCLPEQILERLKLLKFGS